MIAGNTSRFGKNKVMEIGNAAPICGIPISQLPRRHLLRRNRPSSSKFCRTENRQLNVKSETDLNELGNAYGDRPNGCCVRRNSFGHLFRGPAPRTKQRTASVGGERTDRSMGRIDESVA